MAGLLEDLPSDWRVVPFGDVVSNSAFGPRFSGDLYADDGNVATLRTTDMDDDGAISYETMPLARLDTAKFQNHILRKDDLVITRSGTCGIAGIFRGFDKPVLPGAFLIRLRLNEQVDVRFYRYFFNSKPGRGHLLSIAAGAVQQNINITNLEKLPVPLPPLPVQRRIAGILSAYDELMENSQRRIRILEAMARALYREWFVHFRFPGHEKHPRVASPLGDIPQGWEWRELSELGFLGRGKSRHRPRNEASLYGGPYPFFQTGDIKDARIFLRIYTQTYSEAGLAQSKLWQPGTLCITIAANIAETAILAKTGCFPDSVVGFVPDLEKSDAFYVKMYLDSIKQQMQNVSRGTTQDNLSLEKLLSFQVLSPPPSIIRTFREKLSPMLELLNVLLQKEEVLRRTRELLLPRLLSGQVDLVSRKVPARDLEQTVADNVAEILEA